ncbi:MAG TPA: peptidoglycan DD-metalloendopeptidase family protein [Rhodocyclaceae bacterium]|nr:peptidoglycan DD-metalloendopeptidase family protein [Rhodocyclaceae bacterium]
MPPVPEEKKRILAHLRAYRDAKPGPFWAAIGLAAASFLGMVAAFGTAPTTQEIQGLQQNLVEDLALPRPPIVEASVGSLVREERVRAGDTVAGLLERLGARDDAAIDFLRGNATAAAIFRQLSPGKTLTASVSPQGGLQSLVFPLNGGKDLALFVERDGDTFKAEDKPLPLETHVELKSAEIRYSLFGATDAAGIPDSVATGLADIFGGDIDFHRDIRKGDRFSVIYESVNYLGKPIRTGRILAAEFVNDGHSFRAIWYQPEGSEGGYYTADGKNIRKAFLRSPLEFSRITSGFTSARFHPILKEWRAHRGIDYGAPTGTRVKATGDGIVEFAGRQGGYGNMIILRHQGRYTTVYGHLSGFAAGLRKGTRVSQGEVIGFVGATGLATGPHLHYEFRVDGVFQNPLTIVLPAAPPLAANQLPGFRQLAQGLLARLEMARDTNIALLN